MNSAQRREKVLSLLTEHSSPLSATVIAKQCGVSRQIIVGDVALLRAAGSRFPPRRGDTCCTANRDCTSG